jgi:hypothetical protein
MPYSRVTSSSKGQYVLGIYIEPNCKDLWVPAFSQAGRMAQGHDGTAKHG